MKLSITFAILLGVLCGAPAYAQQAATAFHDLPRLIKPGETIYITNMRGVTIKGTLVDISASSLELHPSRDSSIPLLRVAEADVNNITVHRADPWWNGPLIGFAAGAGPGLLIELAGRTQYEKFSGLGAAGLGGIGLLTGLLIDALHTDKVVVYVHPPEQRSSRLRVSPSPAKSGIAVQVSVSF